MRNALALFAVSLAATACSSHFPASPVPAALSDREAARLAEVYLAERNVPPNVLVAADRGCDGYLMTYKTNFDLNSRPPRESHLVLVRNDGMVRELTFAKDQ